MKCIQINEKNIAHEHICCAIGNDKINKARSRTKKEWLQTCLNHGLVFKRLDDRGKMFIEYMPVAQAWKPVKGSYMLINCLWVSGKFKDKGIAATLLEECIRDTTEQDLDGIVVVTSPKKRPFLTDKKFFIHKGFTVADQAPPYFELLVLPSRANAEVPRFTGNARNGTCKDVEGFTFLYSNQCPFTEEYVLSSARLLARRAIPHTVHKITSSAEAKTIGSPFGTLGIYYKGQLVTHELMPEKKFLKFITAITL
ncbi:MAG: GNAT family N-acetyltransferase [Desulfobulbus sp.]|nr:MAG: GNAT family N-acetyltransferase [Desulfobulbus sp.]